MRLGGGGGAINAEEEGTGRLVRAEDDMAGEVEDIVAHESGCCKSGQGSNEKAVEWRSKRASHSI